MSYIRAVFFQNEEIVEYRRICDSHVTFYTIYIYIYIICVILFLYYDYYYNRVLLDVLTFPASFAQSRNKPICRCCCCAVWANTIFYFSFSHSRTKHVMYCMMLHYSKKRGGDRMCVYVCVWLFEVDGRGGVGVINVWRTRAEMKFWGSKTFRNRLPTSTITLCDPL